MQPSKNASSNRTWFCINKYPSPKAPVGIAIVAAGSDVAVETADIALMGDKLEALPFAIGLSCKACRNIPQNLWISFGMGAVLIPLTIFGHSRDMSRRRWARRLDAAGNGKCAAVVGVSGK